MVGMADKFLELAQKYAVTVQKDKDGKYILVKPEHPSGSCSVGNIPHKNSHQGEKPDGELRKRLFWTPAWCGK
jgi:hypothetical protein